MKGFVNLTHTNNKKIKDVDNKVSQKLNAKPDGKINLINAETGKIDNAYIPTNISSTSRRFAGTFGEDGIIIASAYESELNGKNINDINTDDFVGCEFLYTGNAEYNLMWSYTEQTGTTSPQQNFNGLTINHNDIIVYNGITNEFYEGVAYSGKYRWTIIDNSDKVVSVNGQTGAVELDIPQAGIEQLVGTEDKPINMATDMEVGHLYSFSGYLVLQENIIKSIGRKVLIFKESSKKAALLNVNATLGLVAYASGIDSYIDFDETNGYISGWTQRVSLSELNGIRNPNNTSIYAPTSGGTAGQIQKSNGDAAPTWVDPSELGLATLNDVNNAIGNVSALLGDTEDLEV